MTEEVPFPGVEDYMLPLVIMKGKRPQKPRKFDAPGITSGVWAVAERCWHEKAKKRPEVKTILLDLENIANPGEYTRRG